MVSPLRILAVRLPKGVTVFGTAVTVFYFNELIQAIPIVAYCFVIPGFIDDVVSGIVIPYIRF